ncbi:MAG: hypothetical protein ACOY3X_04915 [Pseudomonadota bacterium]
MSQPLPNNEVPDPPLARVWEDRGILCTEYPPHARVDIRMARYTFERRRALLAASGRKRHRIMISGSRVVSFDYASYRFSAGKEVSDTVTAAALVCSSALERHLSSIFINMWRPAYPIRIFESKEAARAWLDTFPDE